RLLGNGSRPAPSRGEALLAVALNAVWVVGSLILIVDGPLTLLGAGAVAAVAAAVFVFSVLEVSGLRRLREGPLAIRAAGIGYDRRTHADRPGRLAAQRL